MQTTDRQAVPIQAGRFVRAAALALAVLFAVFFGSGSQALADGRIEGALGIRMADGQTAHGDWIRVMLVTGPVPVPAVDLPADLPAIARRDKLGALHQDFFVNVRKRMAESNFLAATTLTTEDGTFLFPRVSSGDYAIIVTFPAMIAGTKVAWQVPVHVADGQTVQVVLDDANMAIPSAAR